MQKTKKKQAKFINNIVFYSKLVLAIFSLLIAFLVSLVLHEASHAFTLCLCNGNIENFSFGTQSFVGGYVDIEYIPVVSLASIFIPVILSALLSFIRRTHVLFFNMGLAVSTFVNIVFGLFATAFIHDNGIRVTYDVALAYDFGTYKTLIVIVPVLCLIIEFFCIWKQFVGTKERLNFYFFKEKEN